MRKKIVKIFVIVSLVFTSCNGQTVGMKSSSLGIDSVGGVSKERNIKIINIPFDTTLFYLKTVSSDIDINNDGYKDIIAVNIEKKIGSKMPNGVKNYMLLLFQNNLNNVFEFKELSAYMLYYQNINIYKYKDGFIVKSNGSGQDNHNYYCYIRYDLKNKNWFLEKSQVYLKKYDDNLDKETESLITEVIYTDKSKNNFNQIKFEDIFSDILGKVSNPDVLIKIKSDSLFLLDKNYNKTDVVIERDDDIFLINENAEYLYVKCFINSTIIHGWIKTSETDY